MARCTITQSGAAPCQCSSPGGIQTVSPGRRTRTGPPRAWARPRPVRTWSVWPSGWVCHAVRAPGVNVTRPARTLAGGGPPEEPVEPDRAGEGVRRPALARALASRVQFHGRLLASVARNLGRPDQPGEPQRVARSVAAVVVVEIAVGRDASRAPRQHALGPGGQRRVVVAALVGAARPVQADGGEVGGEADGRAPAGEGPEAGALPRAAPAARRRPAPASSRGGTRRRSAGRAAAPEGTRRGGRGRRANAAGA